MTYFRSKESGGSLFGFDPWQRDVWSVSEVTAYIREMFEVDFRLQDVTVQGEISNFTQARSGHLYFTLKDENAQLRCVMWRSAADRLRRLPEEGDAVLLTGRITVYEAGGVYQIVVERIEPAGRGNLAAAFEALKQDLAAEGLFDATRKKPIPPFPRKIGIVTSADGAALHDMLNVMRRRCALVSVLVAPCLVQGMEAPAQIARSIQWLDGRDDVDVIIIARGGGSLEDLWAFNDEGVARTIYAAHHPIITGVGHETDFTIADFVADLRAPTPSAAAEVAVPDVDELRPLLNGLRHALLTNIEDMVQEKEWQLQSLGRALRHLSPQMSVENNQQRVDDLRRRLEQAMGWRLDREGGRLEALRGALAAVSPMATLARGYAVVRQMDGRVVQRASEVVEGESLRVQVSEGEFGVRVEG